MQTVKSYFSNTGYCVLFWGSIASWIIGIFLGIVLAEASSLDDSRIITYWIYTPSSFANLLFTGFLPFVLSALFIWFRKAYLICIVCLFKAFAVGFVWSICLICFSGAGWVVRPLLLFSQILSIPAYWYFWLLAFRTEDIPNRAAVAVCSLYLLSAILSDYYLIAPFFQHLIMQQR